MKKTEDSPTNLDGIESVLDIGLCRYDPIVVYKDVHAKNNQTKSHTSLSYGFQLVRKTLSKEFPAGHNGAHPANDQ
jgi:hypothetical protein